jgi:hypothetical protein
VVTRLAIWGLAFNPTRWKNHVCSKFRSFVKFPRGGLLECTGRARECWGEGGVKPQREVVEKGMEGRKERERGRELRWVNNKREEREIEL